MSYTKACLILDKKQDTLCESILTVIMDPTSLDEPPSYNIQPQGSLHYKMTKYYIDFG